WPDGGGGGLVERLRQEPGLGACPLIVCTSRELTPQEQERLERLAQSIIPRNAEAPERLLDETALFLHRAVVRMPESQRRVPERLHDPNAPLAGHKVPLVDDELRNN